MKFLLDQDVYAITARHLVALGHGVETASEVGLSAAEDSVLLEQARNTGRIFVTRDRDFGALVYIRGEGPGVLYLRVTPATINAVLAELEVVLRSYTEQNLRKSFVVVEPGRHRRRVFSA